MSSEPADEIDDYERAKADPVAAAILDALHQQDARTYNGRSGSIGPLALETRAKVLRLIAAALEREYASDECDNTRRIIRDLRRAAS